HCLPLPGFSDADYARCKDSFKSTSGGAQFLDGCHTKMFKFFFRTEHNSVRPLSDSDLPITTSWSGKSGCKATVKLAGLALSSLGIIDDVVTDAHSVGINMVLRIVAIPPSTRNLSIPWTVDGTA
nr:hypothetical protein [Tanacetum cinerariifolium]